MYEINELYNEAEKGRQLVVNKNYTSAQLASSIDKVTLLCNAQIHTIKQRLG